MRYETEIRGGVSITKGRQRSSQTHHTSDSLTCGVGEVTLGVDILVDTVLIDDLCMDMHTATGLANDDLWCERDLKSHSPA